MSEMALCTVLLVGAALLLRSVIHLQHKDLGFDVSGLYSLNVELPADRYPTAAAKQAFDAELLERARALPGVASFTVATAAPTSSNYLIGTLQKEGDPEPPASSTSLIAFNGVAADYFRVMGIRLVEGTSFTDTSEAAGQLIVNEGMAHKLWPEGSALGRRLRLSQKSEDWKTVVGVAANASTGGLTSEASAPMLYAPLASASFFRPKLLVRATSDARFVPLLTGIASSIDPLLPPPEVRGIEEAMRSTMARPRFTMWLLGLFSLVGVALAAVGLYGVLTYDVSQRTREIGIRMALGASRRAVASTVVTQALVMAGVGAAAGLLAARWGVKLLAHSLYGVQQTDAASFAAGAAVLAAIAAVACYVPVRRAVSVDPQIAMRAE